MPRLPTLAKDKPTNVELEADVREYLVRRVRAEGRTIKWLINTAVRKEMLAEEALQKQPELFRAKA